MSDSQDVIKSVARALPAIEESPDLHVPEYGTILPLLPLKNVVMLPKSITPIIVGREISIEAVEQALRTGKELFITSQKSQDIETPSLDDLFSFGVRASILQVVRMPNGSLKILAEGLARAKIVSQHTSEGSCLLVQVKDIHPSEQGQSTAIEILAGWRNLTRIYTAYTRLNERAPLDLVANVLTTTDISGAVDTIATHAQLTFEERQSILELDDLLERILFLSSILERETEILHTEQRIRGRVQSQVEKNQKEYYLTEQIKAIHKELGREDIAVEVAQLRKKVTKLRIPQAVLEKVNRELSRIEQLPPISPETSIAKNYVDWIVSLPWHGTSKDTVSIEQAEKILNASHAGLKRPKERILEFIAAKKFNPNLKKSPIMCLVGPPGVGKTSLAASIAQSLGRPFFRISLGGVRDEAEIRGHRRTYIGALPGKIMQLMRRSKVMNPVILLDEIDKMSRDFAGDPASALLEVLDPAQNNTFTDHYLDVEYDLSNVLFVATANSYEGIPLPLLDRMELISLSGYTDEEKVEIARQFLIPKNLKEYNLQSRQCSFSHKIVAYIIERYTKEAGVRQLEQVLSKIMRKVIQVLLKNPAAKSASISTKRVIEWLGNQKYRKTSLDTARNRIGLATGLAWTELGGDVLEIETTILPGKGGVTLTGQLGEVMQESAQAALSYIRSISDSLKIARNFHTNKDIHIHIPEGATPKDGPSAGITICTALISALTKIPVRNDVAMTGEMTLRGRVLSIGGLKEKLIAAKQHNMRLVLIPKENADDLQDIRKEVDFGQNMEIKPIAHISEAIDAIFITSPCKRGKDCKPKL